MAQKRQGLAANRSATLGILLSATKAARKVYRPGALSQNLWGCEVHGMSPTTIAKLRAQVSRATGCFTPGCCTTTILRLFFGLKGDPAVEAPLRAMRSWLRLTHDDEELFDIVKEVWQTSLDSTGGWETPMEDCKGTHLGLSVHDAGPGLGLPQCHHLEESRWDPLADLWEKVQ